MDYKRNYGIDLARLVFMFLICLNHVLLQGGVLNSNLVSNKNIYNILFSFTLIGVDGFALISGYVAQNKELRYEKIVSMWFQVFFYSFGIPFVINILRLFFGNEAFNISEIISGMFPILNHVYWYFDAYIILFFFMPFINRAVFSFDEKKSKKILFILFILIIVMWKNNDASSHDFLSTGRSAFWLILLYIFGMLIKKINLFKSINSIALFIAFIFFITMSLICVKGNALELENIDPFVFISSIIAVILFSRIKPNIKIVSFLSPLSFGVFLFHSNFYYRYYFLSERFLTTPDLLTVRGFLSVIGFTIFTFVFGLFADLIRKTIFEKIEINDLSKTIVKKIDDCLEKYL